MKKITILLLLLAPTYVHSTKKNTPSHSVEEFLAQQIATKELQLKKSEERLQELKNQGAKFTTIKTLKRHIAKKRSSVLYYQKELETVHEYKGSPDSDRAHNKELKSIVKQCNTCCKKHYSDLVMGSLYAILACAVAIDVHRNY